MDRVRTKNIFEFGTNIVGLKINIEDRTFVEQYWSIIWISRDQAATTTLSRFCIYILISGSLRLSERGEAL